MRQRELRTLAVGTLGAVIAAVACKPDLAWLPPKAYTPPPTDSVVVAGFGVDDTVAILPSTRLVSVRKDLTNAGNRGLAAADTYLVRELVVRYGFVSPPPRWVPVDTVIDDTLRGPTPLAAGDTPTFSYVVGLDSCGLYKETVVADLADVIDERDETNNTQDDWFFIPSTQQFNITVDTLQDRLFHSPAQPMHTHDFVVTPAAPMPIRVIFAGFSWSATEGSSASTVPGPGGVFTLPPPLDIEMSVTPRTHTFDPGFGEVVGKVTIISEDGCVLKQQSARAFVEHESP